MDFDYLKGSKKPNFHKDKQGKWVDNDAYGAHSSRGYQVEDPRIPHLLKAAGYASAMADSAVHATKFKQAQLSVAHSE